MTNKPFTLLMAALLFLLPIIAAADTPAAKVGGRTITIEELKKTVNSTPYALPGGSPPTASQKMLVMEVLGNMIDAELLYSDAVAHGVPSSPEFTGEMNIHKRSQLANLYRKKLLNAISPAETDIKKFAKEKGIGEEAAKALLLKESRHKALENESARLFDAYAVKYVPTIATAATSSFADDDILVSSKSFSIYFKDIKGPLAESGNSKDALMDILAQSVEEELFAAAAREAGLDGDKDYNDEIANNSRVLAIVIHRRNLEKRFIPAEKEVSAFIKKNGHLRYKPQTAEVLLIVAKTEREAESLRQRALKGESFYALASEHSIAPNAGINAGRIEPVKIGEHLYSSIDRIIMKMKPEEITQPIKGDKGYSIFKLLSITPREKRDAADIKKAASQLIIETRMLKYLEKLRVGKDLVIYPAVNDL
ncbi:MAG: peptidyl-prolyl cis-trans isomerase [Nitrospinae bacterium]|nr:peptidyl-prolyl cis-trans isomerase [Nitrospinota bacterium]